MLSAAYEMAWPVRGDLSPAAATPTRSPLSSAGGVEDVEAGDRSPVSPDRSSTPGGLTPVVDCMPSAVTAAQLAAATCLHGPVSSPDDSLLLAGVQCRLETKELWDKFYELGTEMIITKSGRSLLA